MLLRHLEIMRAAHTLILHREELVDAEASLRMIEDGYDLRLSLLSGKRSAHRCGILCADRTSSIIPAATPFGESGNGGLCMRYSKTHFLVAVTHGYRTDELQVLTGERHCNQW